MQMTLMHAHVAQTYSRLSPLFAAKAHLHTCTLHTHSCTLSVTHVLSFTHSCTHCCSHCCAHFHSSQNLQNLPKGALSLRNVSLAEDESEVVVDLEGDTDTTQGDVTINVRDTFIPKVGYATLFLVPLRVFFGQQQPLTVCFLAGSLWCHLTTHRSRCVS